MSADDSEGRNEEALAWETFIKQQFTRGHFKSSPKVYTASVKAGI